MNTQPASPLGSFDFQPRTRLIFGEGTLERTGERARDLGAGRALIVTDPGIVKAGHAAHLEQILRNAGIAAAVFDQVRENPTTLDVDACLRTAQSAGVDSLIGLGGGSALDTAKGCNFLLTNGGRMQDYWGIGKATRPMLPFIAIPTTAGTGSECQCAALIADEQTHQKMACLDPKAAARVAILDPLVTLSQPPRVTAHTGIDAIAHAVETAVTTKRNPWSLMFSHEAFKLALPSLERVLTDPNDVAARGQMLLSAAFAGMAIEYSMLGAAHAAANPLTALHGVVHGEAVGILLPAVVRFNSALPEPCLAYAQLAAASGIARLCDGLDEAVCALVAHLESLLNRAGIAPSLAVLKVCHSDIGRLAEMAARQWTGRFNPRPITAEDFAALYEAALEPRSVL